MDILYKRNIDLSEDELEALYNLHYSNVEKFADEYKKYSFLRTQEYKNKWINDVKKNNDLICVACVVNGFLIGFLLLILKKEENYIREFHIAKNYQKDGKTFRMIVEKTFQISQVNKDFTGRIWSDNNEAKRIFRSMGAFLSDGKYVASYDNVRRWIENKPIKL